MICRDGFSRANDGLSHVFRFSRETTLKRKNLQLPLNPSFVGKNPSSPVSDSRVAADRGSGRVTGTEGPDQACGGRGGRRRGDRLPDRRLAGSATASASCVSGTVEFQIDWNVAA